MNSTIWRAAVLGLTLASASFSGCSSEHPKGQPGAHSESAGDLGFQLQVGDLMVTSVHYVLTNGTNSYSGDINVADAGTLTAVIGGIVAGTGYTVTLTATATDGTSQCSGSASGITVAANQTATVGIQLRCMKLRNKGGVFIDGTYNECPDITAVVGDAPVGCAINLHVSATDDGKPNPPGMLAYSWTGANGLVGANPTLNCESSGFVQLTVNVSDGDVEPTCSQTFGVTLICPPGCPLVAPTCTDGIQNQGESDIDCGGSNCAACASGQHCVAAADCAGGLVCLTTTCQPPPQCTDQLQQCGGPCPPCPVTTNSLLGAKGQACTDCAISNCSNELSNNCNTITGNATEGPATGQTKSSLCLALLQCELSSNCGAVSSANCYCGAGGGATCFSSGATNNGACKTQEEAGLESTAPPTIQSRYQTASFGGGRANKLVQCLKNNGCDTCLQ